MKSIMIAFLQMTLTLLPPTWAMEDEGSIEKGGIKRKYDESFPLQETKSTEENDNLTDLRGIQALKPYLEGNKLEINPENHLLILQLFKEYKNRDIGYSHIFARFDGGIVVKGWKASLGFKPLMKVLWCFTDIKSLKIGIDWDKQGSAIALIQRTIQFFKDLEELDMSNCHLNDEHMECIAQSLKNPQKLSVLRVPRNPLSWNTISFLRNYFENLARFEYDLPVYMVSPCVVLAGPFVFCMGSKNGSSEKEK